MFLASAHSVFFQMNSYLEASAGFEVNQTEVQGRFNPFTDMQAEWEAGWTWQGLERLLLAQKRHTQTVL